MEFSLQCEWQILRCCRETDERDRGRETDTAVNQWNCHLPLVPRWLKVSEETYIKKEAQEYLL
jgi:hypothetical protein